jgi:NADP-dependent 3-hydroxy acid dehydrogenase YdfG
VARVFAREGARVFLAGRTLAKLDAVAKEISAAGGIAETAHVDALDEQAVNKHLDAVAAKAGSIDIALNAIGILHVQGTPLAELSFEDYAHPITTYTRTHFLTAKAVARHMVKQGSGVIPTLSTPAARMSGFGLPGLRRDLRGHRDIFAHSGGRTRAQRNPCRLSAAECDS